MNKARMTQLTKALDTVIAMTEGERTEFVEQVRLLPRPSNGQPIARPVTEDSRLCPVSGKALAKGKVFAGWGNDARAKSVVNNLLSGDESRVECGKVIAAGWHAPEMAEKVAALASAEGMTKVAKVQGYFAAAMAEPVEVIEVPKFDKAKHEARHASKKTPKRSGGRRKSTKPVVVIPPAPVAETPEPVVEATA